MKLFKALIRKFFRAHGFAITPLIQPYPLDLIEESAFIELYEKCKPFTMTSIARMYALYKSIAYIVKNNIPGDIAECGVWRGGSVMLAAYTLLSMGDTARTIYLYDTFAGMTAPGPLDSLNRPAKKIDWFKKRGVCYAEIDEVQSNLCATGYPKDKILFIEGDIKDTVPRTLPNCLALLRLDTDWYETTLHELEHMFPRVCAGGVLIIDDYGDWKGARKAADEYFQKNNTLGLLHRIDHTGRMGIKS